VSNSTTQGIHYPIISLLRRACLSHSYTISPELKMSEVGHFFNASQKWEKGRKPIFLELISQSSDPATMATDLCKEENRIYESAGLSGHAYSLIFGPCESGIVRVCVMRGLWRDGYKKTISSLS